MTALRIHEHGINHHGISFPLVPKAARTTAAIGGLAPLQHQSLDDRMRRVRPFIAQVIDAGEGNFRRKVEPFRWQPVNDHGECIAALFQVLFAQVVFAVEQAVIQPGKGWMAGQHTLGDYLAVQALLQVGKGADCQRFAKG